MWDFTHEESDRGKHSLTLCQQYLCNHHVKSVRLTQRSKETVMTWLSTKPWGGAIFLVVLYHTFVKRSFVNKPSSNYPTLSVSSNFVGILPKQESIVQIKQMENILHTCIELQWSLWIEYWVGLIQVQLFSCSNALLYSKLVFWQYWFQHTFPPTLLLLKRFLLDNTAHKMNF